MILASKTLATIAGAIAKDNGNRFRYFLGQTMPKMGDAYRDDEEEHRSHLGASVLGGQCEREVWFRWRWAHVRPPTGRKAEDDTEGHARMVRLWNRGHLEEARFISLLLLIGVQIFQQDANGKQFKISDFGGHLSGSCDSIAVGIPDLPPGIPCLAEYKTHSAESFAKLVKEGVRASKPEHYVQMMIYMRRLGLAYAIYMAVNKDDDTLHAEIVHYDGPVSDTYMERARRIIFLCNENPPLRMRNASPSFAKCKYLCQANPVCYYTAAPDRTCRSCQHSKALGDGSWRCQHPDTLAAGHAPYGRALDKAEQLAACNLYKIAPAFLPRS